MTPPLLEVRRLTITYPSPRGPVRAVRDVSLQLAPGHTLALVGESGSGKTTLALALPGLLEAAKHVESGEILYRGRNITRLAEREWRKLRGVKIGTLFQDARSTLNPVLTVEAHLVEAVRAHRRISLRQAREEAIRLLEEVGIPEPQSFRRRYPFELSTGLCQRVGLALGICGRPELLIADEPTSALDPSLQAQIVQLLRELKARHGLTLLLVSHDLAMTLGLADTIAVMYLGRIVERGQARDIIGRPTHPYTQALLACLPDMHHHHEDRLLPAIPGIPPIPETEFRGCAFAPRCGLADAKCTEFPPPTVEVSESHQAACHKTGGSPT